MLNLIIGLVLVVSATGSERECTNVVPCSIPVANYKAVVGDSIHFLSGDYENLEPALRIKEGVNYRSVPGHWAKFTGGTTIRMYGSNSTLSYIEVSKQDGAGIYNTGSNNTIHHIYSHHNNGSGLTVNRGDNFTVTDSVFMHNSDEDKPQNGGNADGISFSSGNGHRAINNVVGFNSDDGIDTWKSDNAVVKGNIVFSNGIAAGNGKGIKAGPGIGALVQDNFSFDNTSCDYTHNSGVGIVFIGNVSAESCFEFGESIELSNIGTE